MKNKWVSWNISLSEFPRRERSKVENKTKIVSDNRGQEKSIII